MKKYNGLTLREIFSLWLVIMAIFAMTGLVVPGIMKLMLWIWGD